MSDIARAGYFADLTSSDLIGVLLGAVGAILVLVGAYFATVLISEDPAKIEPWRKLTVVGLLLGGFVLSLAGLSGAIWDELTEPEAVVAICQAATVITPAQSFRNLLTNARVERLIKFKLHKRGAPNPSTMLGPQDASLTIVSDYDELRGRTVADAVRLLGYKIQPGDAVTAIAFPRAPWRITPAGALGLLQVVAAVEATLDSGKKLGIEQALSPAAVKGLALGEERPPLEVWGWSTYGPYYPEYCQLALKFRCDPSYAAAAKFGDFDNSWHPLGFAEQTKMLNDLCTEEAEAKLCRIANAQTAWPELKPYYGARIFLIENAPLSAIAGKVVIEFEAPEAQHIPPLDLSPAQ